MGVPIPERLKNKEVKVFDQDWDLFSEDDIMSREGSVKGLKIKDTHGFYRGPKGLINPV